MLGCCGVDCGVITFLVLLGPTGVLSYDIDDAVRPKRALEEEVRPVLGCVMVGVSLFFFLAIFYYRVDDVGLARWAEEDAIQTVELVWVGSSEVIFYIKYSDLYTS